LPRVLASVCAVSIAAIALSFGLLIAAVGFVAGLIGWVFYLATRHRFPSVARSQARQADARHSGTTIEGEYKIIK